MRIRRCAAVFLEPRETAEFSLHSLLDGGDGMRRERRWLALAPHLDGEVEVDAAERELLGNLSPNGWVDPDELPRPASAAVPRLLECGLVVSDDPQHAMHRQHDETLRAQHWWPPAALAHRFGRWEGLDCERATEESGLQQVTDLRRVLGPPPPHLHERGELADRIPLQRVPPSAFDDLLARRVTCRNFDPGKPLSAASFAHMLQRSFAAQAQLRVSDDMVFLKKTSPSGGGLHPTGAYVIVQRVENVTPGLYHYHPLDHALEPLPAPSQPLADFALCALAGQYWFADAPALVVLAARYARSFWKYRNHAKAYRALVLDSGHLSQTLYLSATELGLGAFVTSAINEVDIEQAFGLDPLVEGPLAICGFGWRGEVMETTELDPAGKVWALASG